MTKNEILSMLEDGISALREMSTEEFVAKCEEVKRDYVTQVVKQSVNEYEWSVSEKVSYGKNSSKVTYSNNNCWVSVHEIPAA